MKKKTSTKKAESKFESAYINDKEYSTLSGFKKGLKANGCPFDVDKDGLFKDSSGRLKRRQWNRGGKKFEAVVQIS